MHPSHYLHHLGWGWGGLQEAHRPEEGQEAGLPAAADGRVRGQPHQPGVRTQGRAGCKGQEEEEEEEEGQQGTTW